jgi:uncharacterized protein
MKQLLLAAIRAYQRYVSPYKGFSCAWRVHRGGQSCSGYGHHVIARYGARRGLALLGRRLDACGETHRIFHKPVNYQSGHCDLPSCDLPSCDLQSGDTGQVCDCIGNAMGANCSPCGRHRTKSWAVSDSVRAKYKSSRRSNGT